MMNSNLRIVLAAIEASAVAEADQKAANAKRDAAIWRLRREDGMGPTEIHRLSGMTLSNVRRVIHDEDVRRGWAP